MSQGWPGTPVSGGSTGPVFVPGPGAADEAARRDQQAGLDTDRTGVTLEGGARAAREEVRGAAKDLRDQFEKQKVVTDYQTALPAYTSILNLAAQKPNKANDFTIITMFNKVQDPGSAVLEGERQSAQNVSTLYEKYKAQLEGTFNPETGFVSDDARRQFVKATHALISERRRAYDAMRSRYSDIAKQPEYGIRPELVVGADFGQAFVPEIMDAWPKIFPLEKSNAASAPTLQVATGKTFSTEQDMANASALNALWSGGATIDQMNAKSVELTGSPLSAEALDYLQKNNANRNLPAVSPASSGGREASAGGLVGDIRDTAVGLAGGAIRGSTANMAEELVNFIDPDTAAKLQAALQYGQEQAPVSSFVGELAGGVASPLSRMGGAISNPIAREAVSGALYGGLYGAGEAAPNASLSERIASGAIGATTGGIGGAIGGKIAQRMGGAPAAGMADNVVPVADELGVPGAPGPIPTPATSDMEAVVDLARKATSRAPGRTAARRELAAMAKVNPAAQEAADRLGIALPADVLSDNAQLLSLTGLSRSQVGSEAENAWTSAVQDTIKRSDAVMDELGATTDLAQLSDDVSARLNATMQGMETQAAGLRDEVTAAFKPSDRLDANQTKAALAGVIDELGGLDQAKRAFTGEERKLLAMLGEGEEAIQPTYAMVNRLRREMGEAIGKGKGPWADTDLATVKKYYAALAEDQLGHIESVGGKELADKQRAANSLFSDMYAKREELQTLFGKDLSKSVVPLIRRAITSGAKGDAEAIRKVVANVPEEMRGKVLMSGLLAESAGKGAGNGGFSFANFVKSYRGLRGNAPVYKEFVKYIGDGGDQTLIDLYAISRRMVEAENKVLKTGKANQAMIGQMNAENLLAKVAQSAGGRAVGTVATGAVAGPLVAGGAAMASELAARAGGKTRMDKLHKLMSSDEFRGLMEKLAAGDAPDSAVNRVAASKPFVDFAKRLPIPQDFKSRAEWIKTSFAQTGGNLSTEPEPAQ